MGGEKIYEYIVDTGEIVEYGLSLAAVLSGEAAAPSHGARFDAHFEGYATGRIAGRVWGTDFAYLRADGRIELDIRATIETADGKRIALSASGIGQIRPNEPVIDLAENVRLISSYSEFDWVNGRQIWASGVAHLAEGKIRVEAFMQ